MVRQVLALLALCLVPHTQAQTTAGMMQQMLQIVTRLDANVMGMKTDIGGLDRRIARMENSRLTAEHILLAKMQTGFAQLKTELSAVVEQKAAETNLYTQLALSKLKAELLSKCDVTTVEKKLEGGLEEFRAAANRSQTRLEATQRCCEKSAKERRAHNCTLVTSLNRTVERLEKTTAAQFGKATTQLLPGPAKDCAEVYARGYTSPGVYNIRPGSGRSVAAYCERRYTTLQRRVLFNEDFDRTFVEYEAGFGSPSKDHWVGLRTMHELTSGRRCALTIQFRLANSTQNRGTFLGQDGDGKMKHIRVGRFAVGAGQHYQLTAENVTTDLTYDTYALTLQAENHGMYFSAKDKDQDKDSRTHCASHPYRGAWWHRSCSWVYPNGKYTRSYECGESPGCAYIADYFVSSTALLLLC